MNKNHSTLTVPEFKTFCRHLSAHDPMAETKLYIAKQQLFQTLRHQLKCHTQQIIDSEYYELVLNDKPTVIERGLLSRLRNHDTKYWKQTLPEAPNNRLPVLTSTNNKVLSSPSTDKSSDT